MSDSEGYEAVTVTTEGVTVTKRFEAEEFPVPAIAFDVDSDRGETVRLTLREQVPEGVAVEDLGFHPEYGSEHWTIDEDEITFERDIEPGAEYTTVYGIRATGTDNVERFLAEPDIERIDPPVDDGPEPDTDVLPEDGEEVVRDVISGEAESVPGVEEDVHADQEEEEADGDEEDVEPLELNDPEAESPTESEPAPVAEPDRADEPAGTTESVVATLTAELEAEDADAVDRLRAALGVDEAPDGSITARVDRLQRDVSNLRAYTDALEEFLDEEGTADEQFDEVRSGIAELESAVEEVEATVAENATVIESIEDRLAETTETVGDLDASVATLESDVEDLREAVEQGELADRLEAVEAELEDLREWQTQIKQTFGGG